MSSHLFRRGGIWWVRLVIPARLRDTAGKREFVKSCRTHELAIAKLVCAVFLADWRSQIIKIESREMTTGSDSSQRENAHWVVLQRLRVTPRPSNDATCPSTSGG